MVKRLIGLTLAIFFGVINADKVIPVLKDGEITPTFMLPNIDDKRVSLRDYCGPLRQSWKNSKQHIVIISFMASYCVPCRKEIPFIEAYAKEKDDDVKIFYISVDTIGKTDLMPFISSTGIKQEFLLDRYGSVMKKYGVQKLPSLFILNKEGALCYQNLDGLPDDGNIVSLLKNEVAKIRNAVKNEIIPLTMHAKYTVMSMLLSGKPVNEIAEETGVTSLEIDEIKAEITVHMKTKWGFKE